MDYAKVLSMNAEDLLYWLVNNFSADVPDVIISVSDMENASKLLLRLSGNYSYLQALLSYAKIETRKAKRGGDKVAYEDMVDKREVIQNMTDAVKQQYSAISRAVTIHIENNAELGMNTSGRICGR